MHPDDHYDEARAEELDERAALDYFDLPLTPRNPGPTWVENAADWQFPPPTPGITHRGLGWARTGPEVPPRHTETRREELASTIMLGFVILTLIIAAAGLAAMLLALALL